MIDRTIEDSDRCACDVHSSTNWPISTFFLEKDEATHRCKGGDDAGYLCTPASQKAKDSCRGGTCTRAFSRQYSVAVSSRYGCYFLHPGSQAPVKPEYHACGTVTIRNSAGQEDENSLKYQKAVDVSCDDPISMSFKMCAPSGAWMLNVSRF